MPVRREGERRHGPLPLTDAMRRETGIKLVATEDFYQPMSWQRTGVLAEIPEVLETKQVNKNKDPWAIIAPFLMDFDGSLCPGQFRAIVSRFPA